MMAKPETSEAAKKRRPSFPIYAVNRFSDPGLRACSRAARSFYLDLECYVHAYGEPQGYLTLENGTPLKTADEIARQIPDSTKDIGKWLAELTQSGVIARDETGIICLPKLLDSYETRAAWLERKNRSNPPEGANP
jgi:hypothetical protein